jgi:molybdate transport system regulatory protein
MAIVKIDVGDQHMSATLTAEAVEEFGLAEGAEVYAIFKATAVMIGVD